MFDDAARMDITILDGPTPIAFVDSVFERLRCYQSTTVAFLRCSASINLSHQPTSVFSFVGSERDELSPRCIEYGLRQDPSCKPSYVQLFKCDVRVAICQGTGQLVRKIPALVSYVSLVSSKVLLRLESALAATLASCKGTLKATIFLRSVLGQLWGGNDFPVRCGDQVGQSNINTHSGSKGVRPITVGSFYREADKPLPARSRQDSRSDLRSWWDFSMPASLNLSGNTDDVDLSAFPDCHAVANTEFGTVKLAFRPEPREPTFAIFCSAKEPFERPVKPAKDLLFCGKTISGKFLINGPNRFQLAGLVKIVESFSPSSVSLNPLLKCCVVEITEAPKHLVQRRRLRWAWINPVLVAENSHLLALLISRQRKPFHLCIKQTAKNFVLLFAGFCCNHSQHLEGVRRDL